MTSSKNFVLKYYGELFFLFKKNYYISMFLVIQISEIKINH